MNTRAFALASAAVALLAANAQAYTIDDEDSSAYWGAGLTDTVNDNGDYTSPGQSGDVYDPDTEGYAISGMDVSYDRGELTVTIYSAAYFDNWRAGELEAGLGSLFLSTNGWNPTGSAAENYNTDGMDAAHQGEVWEYAITLAGDTIIDDSGVAYLYSTDDGSIVFGTARDVQEAFFTGADGMAQTEGTWAYELIDGHYALVITMSIGNIWDGSEDLGLHWTMLCANDVVEGSIPGNPVPEPGTLALFAIGALGLAGAGRRRRS